MRRLGDDARRILSAAGPPGAGALTEVTAVWPECVGEAIARAAWPQRLARDGTLHVSTSSSTWAFELGRLADDVLGRLRERLGEAAPQALRFAPGHVPEPGAPDRDETPAPLEVTSESRSSGDRLAAAIDDEELRRLVARAAAVSLERARSDRGFC
jgi:hypothetical protein